MTATAHCVFGLGVWSDVPLPPLADLPVASRVDVRIWLTSRPSWLIDLDRNPQAGPDWYISPHLDAAGRPLVTASFLGDGRYLRLRYREGTEFVLDRGGEHIAVRQPDTLTLDDVESYVLGPVLGLLLRYRGQTCLHASAVAVGGHAVVFVGTEGAGKSTIAAALAAHGYPVVSDDIVPLEERAGTFMAHPGCARVRLWRPSSQALSMLRPGRHWEAALATDRRYNLDLQRRGYRFQAASLPLGAIYLLRTDDRPTTTIGFESVRPREAMMSLVANTYATRLLERSQRAREFDVLATLVESVPIRRVHNGGSLDRLNELCDAFRSDVERVLPREDARGAAIPSSVARSR